jgi:hypothetical protein
MSSLRLCTRESVRFSRNRDDAILALHEKGRMTVEELARACAIPTTRARAVLYGDPPDYALEYALVRIEIVREVRTRFGPEIELTEKGASEALILAEARAARRRL